MAEAQQWWKYSQTASFSKPKSIPNPPNYTSAEPIASTSKKQKTKAIAPTEAEEEKAMALNSLRSRKAWDLAMGPAKQIPMQGFMMWMSGSTVQIFSMMTTGMLVKSSIQGALNVNKVFNPLASGTPSSLDPETPNEEDAFIQQKLVYIACQLALLALAFYKVNSMGLLPNHSSDWLAFLPVKVPMEMSSVSVG